MINDVVAFVVLILSTYRQNYSQAQQKSRESFLLTLPFSGPASEIGRDILVVRDRSRPQSVRRSRLPLIFAKQ